MVKTQRWSPQRRPSPRGHIFKPLALASMPQVLENCPVLGSRTTLFFEWLKFCISAEKCFSRPFFFLEIDRKKFLRPFILEKHLHLCPWSLALASSISVLDLGLGFFCVLGLGLVPCVVDSTSVKTKKKDFRRKICKKAVFAHEYWIDDQYFGGVRPRTAAHSSGTEPVTFFET